MLSISEVRHDAGMTAWFEEPPKPPAVRTFILMGYGRCLYWINGEKCVLEKGDALLLPAGTAYYGKSIPSVTHEKYVVSFQTPSGFAPLLPLLHSEAPLMCRASRSELLLARVQTMHEQWREQAPYAAVLCAALLLECLTYVNRELDGGPPSSSRQQRTEQMKAYLRNHYRRKVTKEDLGLATGISPNYAATLFKEMTGQTISAFTHGLRTKTAVYLLRHSELTVADIAEQLGYCDVSYFHKTFKRLTGAVPSDYVKEREARLK